MLAELLEADEEGRGRVEAARLMANDELIAERAAREAERRTRAEAERRKLDDELRQIVAEAAGQAAERRAGREQWLHEREAAARARLDEAVAAWIEIVLGDEP